MTFYLSNLLAVANTSPKPEQTQHLKHEPHKRRRKSERNLRVACARSTNATDSAPVNFNPKSFTRNVDA